MADIVPSKLYKYKKFGLYSLKMLTESSMYFSDPDDFNDPLDCKPEIVVDVDNNTLEALCIKMMAKSSGAEHAAQYVPSLRNMSSYINPEYSIEDYDLELLHTARLKEHIRKLFHLEMSGRGVLSLAESWNCPLMWSHYADQHKGMCFEYEISKSTIPPPTKVDYEGKRCVSASDIIDFYNGSFLAKQTIEHTYFYSKAPEWKYEQEWRFLSTLRGYTSLPFPLSAIYFGMKCNETIVTTIVNLMKTSNVAFFRVFPKDDTFSLERSILDSEDIEFCKPLPPLAYIFGSQSLP